MRYMMALAGFGSVAALVAVVQGYYWRFSPLGRLALVLAGICVLFLVLGLAGRLSHRWLGHHISQTIDGFLDELINVRDVMNERAWPTDDLWERIDDINRRAESYIEREMGTKYVSVFRQDPNPTHQADARIPRTPLMFEIFKRYDALRIARKRFLEDRTGLQG